MSKYTQIQLSGMAHFILEGLKVGDPKSLLLIMRRASITRLEPNTIKRLIQALI